MLTSEKTEMLRAFLGTLSKETAMRLATAVEVDRLVVSSALPHDVILDGLRPILRQTDVHARTPTPLRLFCRPFEDLLVNIPRKEKQKGRVLRTHVVPVWHWLTYSVLPEEAAAYSNDVRECVVARDEDAAIARAELFWPQAGEALQHAVAQDPKGARAALGSDLAMADAQDIAMLLKAGRSMLAVQTLLPKPTPSLTEDLLWALRRIYDHVLEQTADAAPFVSVVAMRRLARPWEALKLALLVARQTQDTLISSTDMGLAGDVLFTDMEDNRLAIMAVRHPNFDPDALIGHLAAFTHISAAIVKEVEILRHGKWGQRLLKDRAAVGSMMEGFMERAPKEIAAALPSQKAGFAGGPRVPDFSHAASPERLDRALRYARILAGTKLLAVPGSFGAKHQDALDEATHIVRAYNEDIIKELRTAQGPRREIVEAQFQLAVELTALLYDESEAEFLRRRGRAASAPAVAA